MIEENALLQRILDAPEDDEPRLRYAELLTGRGDPRGEFIQVQLRIAELHQAMEDTDELARLEKKEEKLLRQHKGEWTGAVAKLVREVTFHRGFPEEVTLTARALLDRAQELYRLAPVLHLNLEESAGLMGEVCASPHLARIASLNLWRNKIGDEGARAIAGSPHLGRLTWLDLGHNQIGRPGLEALYASKSLPRLAWLGFYNNLVEDPTERKDGTDQGFIMGWEVPQITQELEAVYGVRKWAHFTPEYARWHPPNRIVMFRAG